MDFIGNYCRTIALKGRQELGGFSKHSLTLQVHWFIKSSSHALLPPLMRGVIRLNNQARIMGYGNREL